jgi:hypothetical protein
MNQLSVIPVGRELVDLAARRRRKSADALFCRWRCDPATGALSCLWTTRRAARETASPVPWRRAS